MSYLSTDEVEPANDVGSDSDSVHLWRHEQFVRLGFDTSQATLLAYARTSTSVRDLMSRGCERRTLMRIVI